MFFFSLTVRLERQTNCHGRKDKPSVPVEVSTHKVCPEVRVSRERSYETTVGTF